MKTEFDFLRDLETDLEQAAGREPRARSGRAALHGRKPLVALVAVIVLSVAGGIGYVARSGAPPTNVDSYGPLPRAAGGGTTAHISHLRGRDAAVSDSVQQGKAIFGSSVGKPSGAPGQLGLVGLVGPQIVKTAELDLTVKKGRFDDAFRQASLVAAKYGGFVGSSSTQGSKPKSGKLEIRVPALSFEQALADLRALGTVGGESVSGQDVTAQYVDLQARIRTWQAQEDVLLKLMDRASSVADTLRVQNNLQDVQLEIERLKGQLQVLQDQADNGTIAVSLREAGAPIKRQQKEQVSWLPDFRKAWHDTVRGFLGVLLVILVGLGYIVPLGLLLGALWAGYRRVRVRVGA